MKGLGSAGLGGATGMGIRSAGAARSLRLESPSAGNSDPGGRAGGRGGPDAGRVVCPVAELVSQTQASIAATTSQRVEADRFGPLRMERASSVMAGVTHVMIVNGRLLLIPSSGLTHKLEKTRVALLLTFDGNRSSPKIGRLG